jgi:hypothetical protein
MKWNTLIGVESSIAIRQDHCGGKQRLYHRNQQNAKNSPEHCLILWVGVVDRGPKPGQLDLSWEVVEATNRPPWQVATRMQVQQNQAKPWHQVIQIGANSAFTFLLFDLVDSIFYRLAKHFCGVPYSCKYRTTLSPLKSQTLKSILLNKFTNVSIKT